MKTLVKLILVFIITAGVAQEKTISGIVTSNSDGIPLPGVNVIIKGASVGAQTNFDGRYSIKAKPNDILVFSYIGFKTKNIKVKNETIINASLEEDAESLDEIVVVGYGTTQRRSYTASVSQIKRQKQKAYHKKLANQLKNKSLTRNLQVLQGKVSGVQITKETSQKANAQIVIRGVNSFSKSSQPLFVIDGVVSSSNNLENIKPETINNINVIKGVQATSMYGNKAKNGVVVVSTKNNKKDFSNEPQFIVDGVPILKEHNYLVGKLPKTEIDSKTVYDKNKAKDKFGKIAKNGCIVITTKNGNFRISHDESYAVIQENNFERTSLSPLSTFSIDVDKASYSNVRRMINNGMPIDPDAVKIEEMINYFNYNYPQPTDKHPFSIHAEAITTPWNNATKLVKIGLQGKTYENEALPASNLTFLIDVSGSMGSQNKLPLLKSAFKLLVNQLRKKDKVSIVVYAGAAGVVLEPTSGDNKEKIIGSFR